MTTPHSRDPGLQPERTWLAWGRTCASALVVAGLAVHPGGVPLYPVLILLLGVALVAALGRHIRRRRIGTAVPGPLMWTLAAVVVTAGSALSVTLLAVALAG